MNPQNFLSYISQLPAWESVLIKGIQCQQILSFIDIAQAAPYIYVCSDGGNNTEKDVGLYEWVFWMMPVKYIFITQKQHQGCQLILSVQKVTLLYWHFG